MKIRWLIITAVAMMMTALMATTAMAQNAKTPQTQKDKLSYSLGTDAARSMRQRGIDLNLELFLRGFQDGYQGDLGGNALMTNEEIRATVTAFAKELQQKAEEAANAQAEKARLDGERFMETNKNKNGVISLPNGLQYEILKAGTGAKPTEENTVTVHYVATMVDGTVFDNTIQKGEPVSVVLKTIIPGWREALKLMPLGSKWRVVIPPSLAYKDRRTGPIPPNSVLIFEIELLGIK